MRPDDLRHNGPHLCSCAICGGYEKGYADAEAKLEIKPTGPTSGSGKSEKLELPQAAVSEYISILRQMGAREETIRRVEEATSTMVYWREKCYEARAEVERLREALGNELSDDSPERHTYSTCIAGEGDQVNADRGCQRCAAWLALRGEGEK